MAALRLTRSNQSAGGRDPLCSGPKFHPWGANFFRRCMAVNWGRIFLWVSSRISSASLPAWAADTPTITRLSTKISLDPPFQGIATVRVTAMTDI